MKSRKKPKFIDFAQKSDYNREMSQIITANMLRVGTIIELDDGLFIVLEHGKVRTGKGGAFVTTTLKNTQTGVTLTRTFRAEEKLKRVRLEERKMTFLYKDENFFYFMDNTSYEQFSVEKSLLGKAVDFLTENLEVGVIFHEEKIIGVTLPKVVKLKVIQAESGDRGDSVTNIMKEAVLETGVPLKVPLFIKEGDIVAVDTEERKYLERVNV
jgi:elongation factor P